MLVLIFNELQTVTKRATPSAQRGWLGVKHIEDMRTPEPIVCLLLYECAQISRIVNLLIAPILLA